MSFFRQFIVYIAVFLAAIWSVLCSAAAIPVFLINMRAGHVIYRAWTKGWLVLLGIKVKFYGLENLHYGSVIAPNHESMFDIFVMGAVPLNYKWIAKVQLKRIPVVGQAMSAMGCFFVRRDKSGSDINVMREVEDGLRHGASVIIFPEGTRSRSGELLPFKKGAFRTAQNAGVPLIPVAIRGTYAIAPPKKVPQRRGHHVTVTIGKPFFVEAKEPLDSAMARFRTELIRLLEANNPLKT